MEQLERRDGLDQNGDLAFEGVLETLRDVLERFAYELFEFRFLDADRDRTIVVQRVGTLRELVSLRNVACTFGQARKHVDRVGRLLQPKTANRRLARRAEISQLELQLRQGHPRVGLVGIQLQRDAVGVARVLEIVQRPQRVAVRSLQQCIVWVLTHRIARENQGAFVVLVLQSAVDCLERFELVRHGCPAALPDR